LLNTIYEKLSKNNSDEKSLKKFEQLMKSKVDFKNLIPSSKSFEGENLLTLSKLWMILILLKINKGKKQQQDFLTLVNSSLTRDLNEYEEYRQFYQDQCEQLFSDEEAIALINKNPRKEKKLPRPISHEEARNNYIYLLYRPEYFKKVEVESFSKIKKLKDKSKSRSSNKTSSYVEDLTKEDETDENDEKGDRLNEDDMIDVLAKIKALKEKENNKGKNKIRTASNKKIKKIEEEKDDSEDKKIKKKRGRRKTENKKRKNITDDEDNSIDEDVSSNNDYDKKIKHNKKEKNKTEKEKEKEKDKKYNKKKDKRKKDSKEEQITEEEEEEKTKNKKSSIKKEKSKEKGEDKRKRNKRKDATESIYALLGIQKSESKSSEKEEKSRKSKSVPPIKKEKGKEKQKGKKSKMKEEKKDSKKSGGKRGRAKKQIFEVEEEEEEEDEYTSDSLSDLSGKNKYEDDLDKFDEDEKKLIEREIKAANEGKIEELDIEIQNLLEGSKAEGFSLDHFNSNESDMDIDEY